MTFILISNISYIISKNGAILLFSDVLHFLTRVPRFKNIKENISPLNLSNCYISDISIFNILKLFNLFAISNRGIPFPFPFFCKVMVYASYLTSLTRHFCFILYILSISGLYTSFEVLITTSLCIVNSCCHCLGRTTSCHFLKSLTISDNAW